MIHVMHAHTDTHIHIHVRVHIHIHCIYKYIHIYRYICEQLCIYIYYKEKEREREEEKLRHAAASSKQPPPSTSLPLVSQCTLPRDDTTDVPPAKVLLLEGDLVGVTIIDCAKNSDSSAPDPQPKKSSHPPVHIKHPPSMVPMKCGNSQQKTMVSLNRGV